VLAQVAPSSRKRWLLLHGDVLWICRGRWQPSAKLERDREDVETFCALGSAEVTLRGNAVTIARPSAARATCVKFASAQVAARWFVLLRDAASKPSLTQWLDSLTDVQPRSIEELPKVEKKDIGDSGKASGEIKKSVFVDEPVKVEKKEAGDRGKAKCPEVKSANFASESPPKASISTPQNKRTMTSIQEEFSKFHVDYAAEGRKLLAAVNLGGTGEAAQYSGCDPIWRHPETGATFFVGDEFTAKNREALRRRKITRIVNCQDSDGENYFEGDPGLSYYRFTIGLWRRTPRILDGDKGTWSFWEQYFAFVQESLGQGHNVLVHCLAGAHRAGTAGIAVLMLYCGWDWQRAATAAQKLRRAIDPIGDFPELLKALEKCLLSKQTAIFSSVSPSSSIAVSELSAKGSERAPLAGAKRGHQSQRDQVQEALNRYSGKLDAKQEVVNATVKYLSEGKVLEATQALEAAEAMAPGPGGPQDRILRFEGAAAEAK